MWKYISSGGSSVRGSLCFSYLAVIRTQRADIDQDTVGQIVPQACRAVRLQLTRARVISLVSGNYDVNVQHVPHKNMDFRKSLYDRRFDQLQDRVQDKKQKVDQKSLN